LVIATAACKRPSKVPFDESENRKSAVEREMSAVEAPQKCCAVVIPTKNAGALFQRVMDGLRRQTIWSDIDLVVVDSGSTDRTIEIATAAGARVQTIAPDTFNHGQTRDYGISLTNAPFVLLMVQDAIPANDMVVESLLNAVQEPGIAGAYARQIPQENADVLIKRNLNNWLTGRVQRETRSIENLSAYLALPPMERFLFCNFDNVCSIIRRSAWDEEKFTRLSFGEDIDWAERVLKRGLKIVYEPAAAVIHSHDRPISYEYKRTYVCHRKLYRQFGLRLIGRRKDVLRSWFLSLASDVKFVLANEPNRYARIKLILRLPLLTLASVYGQYRGALDEIRGATNKVRGV